MQDFAGQVAIVTGAGQGLGFATAQHLAARGATCVLAGRTPSKVQDRAAGLVAAGLSAEAHGGDLSDEAVVQALVDGTMERHGRIDVLVTMSAVYPFNRVADIPLDEWHATLRGSLDTTFLCCRAVVPHMTAAGYGRIVNTSSTVVFDGTPMLAAYVTTKAAILGFTRVLAREVGESGVTANVIMPGAIPTEGTLALADPATVDAHFERTIATQCVKRRGHPDDIAHAVAFLAGREAGFISGQTLNVDGGTAFT